jgi:hypothetical protein
MTVGGEIDIEFFGIKGNFGFVCDVSISSIFGFSFRQPKAKSKRKPRRGLAVHS